MKKEKWLYNGIEVEVPIISATHIEHRIDINLEDTVDLSNVKDRLEETMELTLEFPQKLDASGENYNE